MDKDDKEALQRVAGVPKPPGLRQRRRNTLAAIWGSNATFPTPDTDKEVMKLLTELDRRGKTDKKDIELIAARIGEIVRGCALEVATYVQAMKGQEK